MRTVLILIVGLGGLWFTLRQLKKNVLEIKAKSKGVQGKDDLYFNYPLMVVWFGYLLTFFTGLIVNNLILK